jgi:hypothetical protein
MSVCVLTGNLNYAMVNVQMLPTLIGTAFTFMTYLTGSLFIAIVGGFLFVMGYFVWPFQAYLNQTRIPVLCPVGFSMYQFPALEVMYPVACATMVVWYTIFFRGRPGAVGWFSLFLLFAVPSVALSFFQFNIWYEILMSAGIAIVLSSLFMVHLVLFIAPCIPYLETVPPFTTFSYNDDLGFGVDCQKYGNFFKERQRLHKMLKHTGQRWKPTTIKEKEKV